MKKTEFFVENLKELRYGVNSSRNDIQDFFRENFDIEIADVVGVSEKQINYATDVKFINLQYIVQYLQQIRSEIEGFLIDTELQTDNEIEFSKKLHEIIPYNLDKVLSYTQETDAREILDNNDWRTLCFDKNQKRIFGIAIPQ